MKNIPFLLSALLLVSACQGGGGGGSDSGSGSDDGGTEAPDLVGGSGWTRGFVESFDPEKVAAIRQIAGFVANNVTYRLRIDGHPVFDTATSVSSNALQAARVDYAHSTGLTGAGQTVALIDDGLRETHEQFSGKDVTEIGGSGDGEHGTAVASVMVGNGEQGIARGVAPGADLFAATMSFDTGVDWSQQADFLSAAADAGAIAVNNSWSIGESLSSYSAASILGSGTGLDYIAAMREFAESGVIVFAMQNDYDATSAHVLAGIPLSFPDLEDSFITAVNAIPVYDDDQIISATRISAGCLETAAYCMTANGQIMTATNEADDSYGISTGASFAAPQIAGSMALLAEAFPDLSAQQLRARLLATADNSWFETTGTVEFADGVSHDYNEEFGHGFLNLRDALLPIGEAGIPVASSGGTSSVPLGRSAISGGALSGNAIAASLSSVEIVAIDQLDGVFKLSGDAVAGRSEAVDLAGYRLASLAGSNLKAERLSAASGLSGAGGYGLGGAVMRDLDALALSGNYTQPVFASRTTLVELVNPDEGSAGLRVKKGFDLGSGQLILGVNALHEQGSVMGMTTPGFESSVEGDSYGVQLGMSQRLGGGFGFRIEGEFGMAEGTGGGLVRSFDGIRYDSLRLSLDRGNVFSDGDVMTFFASRPAGISSGSAKMTLPVAASGGNVSYADAGVDLAPADRQVDIGLEYATALTDMAEIRMGFAASFNHGHEAGKTEQQALLGLNVRF